MKILIADAFPDAHQKLLTDAGHTVSVDATLQDDALTAAVADNEILIVRSTRVDAATLDAGAELKLVIRAGAGTNTIDKAHAAANGVRVCNVPGANAVAVAELVMGLIVAIDRRLADNITDLRASKWNKKLYGKARGLFGQTVGILGLGAIGLAVAERARAFGMTVCILTKPSRAADAQKKIAALGVNEVATLDELLAQSDIVTLHLPSTDDTAGMVNDGFLARMKDGATLINTARGELVDEAALIRAMDERGIRAGLDVYLDEPAGGVGGFESALANHPSVCGTHHIGASTEQAQRAVADGVVRVIESFAGGELLNCVND